MSYKPLSKPTVELLEFISFQRINEQAAYRLATNPNLTKTHDCWEILKRN